MNKKITPIRRKIDQLDEVIMHALELRFECVRLLAPHKGKKLNNKAREQEILKKCPSNEVCQIYQKIFSESIKTMRKVKQNQPSGAPGKPRGVR